MHCSNPSDCAMLTLVFKAKDRLHPWVLMSSYSDTPNIIDRASLHQKIMSYCFSEFFNMLHLLSEGTFKVIFTLFKIKQYIGVEGLSSTYQYNVYLRCASITWSKKKKE